jgi:hypothetical protein
MEQQFGVPALYLPQLTTAKPDEPSVPILTTRQEDLRTKKDVVVIVNDHMQDLGVWAYRRICDSGFDAGSCTGTIRALKLRHHSADSEPGLVILNPGQYYYSHKEKRALTHGSWEALPRKSLFHPTLKADATHNLVPGSRNRHEHIATVFEKVMHNEAFVSKDANLYIIGICEGGNSVLSYLNAHWSSLSARVKAASWVHVYADATNLEPSFAKFIETRTRSWVVSNASLNTCIGMPDHDPRPIRRVDTTQSWEDDEDEWAEDFLCPTFSGGDEEFTECVFPKSYKLMIDFFDEVKRGGEKYANPPFEVANLPKEVEKEVASFQNGAEHVAQDLTVKAVDKEDVTIPDTVNKAMEKIKEVELQGGEVEIAGVVVAKDLLEKAGLNRE